MKVTMTDGSQWTPRLISGETQRIQGADRDVLTFHFDGETELAALDQAFTPENCRRMVIQDDQGNQTLYREYVVRTALVKRPVTVSPATAEAPETVCQEVAVSMAQSTYAETRLSQLSAAFAAWTAAREDAGTASDAPEEIADTLEGTADPQEEKEDA